jgi:hypothetical protein
MLTYYDHILGRSRLKRRYKYSALAFVAGAMVGAVLAAIL